MTLLFLGLYVLLLLVVTNLHQTSASVRDFECSDGYTCDQLIRREGFAVLRRAIDPALIDHVAAIANHNADEFTAALIANGILSKPLSQGSENLFVDDPGRSEGYWEIQSRGSLRYEIHHKMPEIGQCTHSSTYQNDSA
jgi:hypothetical protein